MKLALVDSYPGRTTDELQKALECVGIETYIVTSDIKHLQYRNIDSKYERGKHNHIYLPAYESKITGLNLYFPFPHIPSLIKTLNDLDVDIVQTSEHISSPTFWCNVSKKNWKTILLQRSGNWWGIVPKFKIHNFLVKKFVLPKIDGFTAFDFYAANFLKTLGCKKKISITPNPVDGETFKVITPWKERKNIVLFVGRFYKLKFLDKLIISMKKVYQKIPDVELWIIGDGPDRKYIFDLAKGKDYIKFLGTKNRLDLPQFYNQAKVNVSLEDSKLPGIGMTTEEAMACGVPIVRSSDLCLDNPKNVYYNLCGLDLDRIASSIIKSLEEGEKLSKNARLVFEEKYSYNAVGIAYKNLIQDM